MMRKNSLLSMMVFCLLFGWMSKTEALEISPKVQAIGAGTVALVGGFGTWYFCKKVQKCTKEIEELRAENNPEHEEMLYELENKKQWYKKLAWISGGAAAVGAGVGVWGAVRWYRNGKDLPVGQEVELTHGFFVTANEDGSFVTRKAGDEGEEVQIDNEREFLPVDVDRSIMRYLQMEQKKISGSIAEMEQICFIFKNHVAAVEALRAGRPLNRRQKFFVVCGDGPPL